MVEGQFYNTDAQVIDRRFSTLIESSAKASTMVRMAHAPHPRSGAARTATRAVESANQGMGTVETALGSVEFNVVLRQHGQGFAPPRFERDPPATDAGACREAHVRPEV
jgi:hypothetical protein